MQRNIAGNNSSTPRARRARSGSQPTTLALPFDRELVVDLFAGGGGASLGISWAYREPDVAVNHNPVAVGVHEANHPETKHYTCDVFEVDPLEATGGKPVGVLWASPDCRHHSKAKGGKPRSIKIRALAWVVTKWAATTKPRIILLENVEEFAQWGPLLPDGTPCPARRGTTFRRWVAQLRNLGYQVEWRELVAADYGSPTIRKRLYVVARRDGRPIVWPKPTHARKPEGGLKPWRTAAEVIDWSIPGNTIFGRSRPLADNTCKRIAKGLWRFVLNAEQPFMVNAVAPFLTEHANASTQRVFAADEPLRTQVAQCKGGHFALVAPVLVQTGYGERPGQAPRCLDLDAPLGTAVAGGVKHALASAFMVQASHGEGRPGGVRRWGSGSTSMEDPVRTITASGSGGHGVVAAFFDQANGGWYDGEGRHADTPISTICTSGANQRLVTAYCAPHGGAREGKLGLTEILLPEDMREQARRCAEFLRTYLPEHVPGWAEAVVVGDRVMLDIGLRMLVPRELARAQGFPENYVLEQMADGTQVTKTNQVRLIGNSVCPPVAAALVHANARELIDLYERQAIAA